MIIVGYAPLTAVALSMPFQVLATFSGSLANVAGGYLDYDLLPGLTLVVLFGFWGGVAAARRIPPLLLRRVIGLVCCGLGVFCLCDSSRASILAAARLEPTHREVNLGFKECARPLRCSVRLCSAERP